MPPPPPPPPPLAAGALKVLSLSTPTRRPSARVTTRASASPALRTARRNVKLALESSARRTPRRDAVCGARCRVRCSVQCSVRCAVCGVACGVRCGAWCKVQHPLRCTRTSYAQADGLFEPAQQQARDVVGGGTDRNGPPVDRLEDVADAQPCCGGRRALDHADNLDRARARHVAHGHADAAVVCWPLILCEERRVRTRREVACVPVAELGEHRAHSTARLCHPRVVRVGAVATIRAWAGVGHACAIELYLRLRYALLMAFQSFPPNC